MFVCITCVLGAVESWKDLTKFHFIFFCVHAQLQNRMAIFLCNLKPAKMRGVVSQAMLMCASSPEKVELLIPPSGVVPGDRITFEGFPGKRERLQDWSISFWGKH